MNSQNKADWSKAPAAAKFFAVDEDNTGWWFESMPEKIHTDDYGGAWVNGNTTWHAGTFDATNWENSLEERSQSSK